MFGRRRKRAREQADDPGMRFTVGPSEASQRQAAETGSPSAMNQLGTRLKVQGRLDEAEDWFTKAAEAGNQDAMANLALLRLSQGRADEAAEWFRRAGEPLGEALAERLRADGEPPGSPRQRPRG